jgi:hypothetical protein
LATLLVRSVMSTATCCTALCSLSAQSASARLPRGALPVWNPLYWALDLSASPEPSVTWRLRMLHGEARRRAVCGRTACTKAVSAQTPFGIFRVHSQSKTGSQGFQFCRESAQLRRKYLSSRDITLADYIRAQAIGWAGAATTAVRYSAPYSRLRSRPRQV